MAQSNIGNLIDNIETRSAELNDSTVAFEAEFERILNADGAVTKESILYLARKTSELVDRQVNQNNELNRNLTCIKMVANSIRQHLTTENEDVQRTEALPSFSHRVYSTGPSIILSSVFTLDDNPDGTK